MRTLHVNYRAILFDLDGTLLDTLADIGDAANSVLRQFGFPLHALEAYKQFVGEGVAALFQRAVPPSQADAETIGRCASAFQAAYRDHWNVCTRPYEGIPELLDVLAGHELKTAVLSNKPHEFTKACIQHYFPTGKFEVVLGQREGVPRKPDPAGALEIAERLGIPASRFVYLGDSWIDMQTATRSGMHAIGAAWGFRSALELRQAGAREVIDRPGELLRFLEDGPSSVGA
jgi:phosphoglycolate phosphatase